jgi:hypothetical protein
MPPPPFLLLPSFLPSFLITLAHALTQALDLAPLIPSAAKDIMTLYNNRSA